MQRKKAMAVILAASLTMGTVGMDVTTVMADTTTQEGTETTKSTYKAITGTDGSAATEDLVQSNFQFTSGFNYDGTNTLKAYFCDSTGKATDTEVLSTGTQEYAVTTAGVIVTIPDGFKYYTKEADGSNTLYDIYIKIIPNQNITASQSGWKFDIKNKTEDGVTTTYMTLQPNQTAGYNFDYEIWLQDGNTVVSDVDLVAGTCFTATTEGAKPYSDDGKIYSNVPYSQLIYNSTTKTWYPKNSTYDKAHYYILGHGRSSVNKVQGGYARRSGSGGAEFVIGYLTKTVTFQNEENAQAGDLSFTSEETATDKIVQVPTASPKTGYILEYWTADQDATLSDGTEVKKGDRIYPSSFKGVVADKDITFTAHYCQYLFTHNYVDEDGNVSSTPTGDLYLYYEKTNTDPDLWAANCKATIAAPDKTYDGKAYDEKVTVDLSAIQQILPDAEMTGDYVYYKKADGETEPNEANKLTSAPTDAGEYWVVATIDTSVKDANGNNVTATVYTDFEIAKRSVTVKANSPKYKAYGTEDPNLKGEYTVEEENSKDGTGLVNGDELKNITVSRKDADTTEGEKVGDHTITVSQTAGSNPNYSITFVDGTLTIKEAYMGDDVKADNYEGTYDGGDRTITVTAPEGAKVTYSLTKDGEYTEEAPTVKNVTEGTTIYYKVEKEGYTPVSGEATVKISQKEVTVTPTSTSKTYGAKDPAFEYTTDGVVDGESLTDITISRAEGEAVGTYTMTGTEKEGSNPNYKVSFKEGTFTIGAASMDKDVSAEGYEGTYDGAGHTITVTAPEGAKVTYSLTKDGEYTEEAPTVKNVTEGTTIYYKVEKEGYTPVSGEATVKISQKEVTVTPTSTSKTYGAKDPAFEYTTDGVVDGESLTDITISRAEGEAVGTYTMTGTEKEGSNPNYKVSFKEGEFTINNASFNEGDITVEEYSGTYDGKGHSIKVTTTGTAEGATIYYSTTGAEGSYTLDNPSFTDVDKKGHDVYVKIVKDNYETAYSYGQVKIYKKDVTVTPENKEKTYGDPEVTLTYTANEGGLVEGDTLSGITLSRVAGENVGSYGINGSVEEDANPNYNVTIATGTYTINPKEVKANVTAAGKTYDGNTTATVTATVTEGLVGDDTITIEGLTGDFEDSNVGTGKNVTVHKDGAAITGAGNYNVVIPDTTKADITKAPSSGTATGKTDLVYDGTPKELVTPGNDLIGGEIHYIVDGVDTTDIPKGTDAGEYEITYYVKGDGNHDDTKPTTITVTIKNAENEVTASGYSAPYDGQPHTITVTAPEGSKVTYSADGVNYTDEAPTYTSVTDGATVYYRVERENYDTVEGSKSVTITKKPVTAVITADNKTYDGEKTATVHYTLGKEQGVVDGDTITIDGLTGNFDTPDAGEDKKVTTNSGSDAVVISGADNYEVTIPTETTADITAAESKVTVTRNDMTYNGGEQTPITVEDVIEGTKVHYSLDGVNWVDEIPTVKDAGDYTIYYYVEGDNNHSDLGSKEEPKSIQVTVKKKAVTVTPENKEKVYEEADEDLTYKAEGLVDGETLTDIKLSRDDGENVGDYTIHASQTEGANSNYAVTFADGTYTITPKSIIGSTVSLGEALIYNGEEQSQDVLKVILEGKDIPDDAYEVTENTGTDPGVYTLTITAKDGSNYKDSITWNFVISPKIEDQTKGDGSGDIKDNDQGGMDVGQGDVQIQVKGDGVVPASSIVTSKVDILNMLIQNGHITSDELSQISSGASENVVLTISDATNKLNATAKKRMQSVAGDYTIAQYIGLDLQKYLTVDGVTQDGISIKETAEGITVSIEIPDSMINTSASVSRTYRLVRYFNGTAELVEGTYDEATHTLTFETNKFGEFALAYKDTAVITPTSGATPTPTAAATQTTTNGVKTGDPSSIFGYAGAMLASLGAAFGSLKLRRKKREDDEE